MADEISAALVAGVWARATPDATEEQQVFTQLTPNTLDTAALTHLATDARCGAIATFLGTTRCHFEGREVERLEYEAYPAMAARKMVAIGEAVFARYEGVHKVVVAHRVGTVPVGEASVIIAVATEHRRAGLDAVSWAIDELKATVPVWKREVYVGPGPESERTAVIDCCGQKWKSNPEFVARYGAGAAANVTAAPPTTGA